MMNQAMNEIEGLLVELKKITITVERVDIRRNVGGFLGKALNR